MTRELSIAEIEDKFAAGRSVPGYYQSSKGKITAIPDLNHKYLTNIIAKIDRGDYLVVNVDVPGLRAQLKHLDDTFCQHCTDAGAGKAVYHETGPCVIDNNEDGAVGCI